jgi:hypothetical protein
MKAVGHLEHPHIIRATDAGEHDGTHFLVMELIDGLDLSTVAQRLGPLPVADAYELIRQAAVGLLTGRVPFDGAELPDPLDRIMAKTTRPAPTPQSRTLAWAMPGRNTERSRNSESVL